MSKSVNYAICAKNTLTKVCLNNIIYYVGKELPLCIGYFK